MKKTKKLNNISIENNLEYLKRTEETIGKIKGKPHTFITTFIINK